YTPLTTEWKTYQLSFTTNGEANSRIRFDLAESTGDVWIEDVHVTTGDTSVWRRDFEHGIVLINPDPRVKTFALEKPFKKILGAGATDVNDGTTVTTVTLGVE